MPLILVRYGEIGLKSQKVKRLFENALASNIRSMLARDNITAGVWPEFGRIYVRAEGDEKNALSALRRVFGITSMSPVVETTSKPEDIMKIAVERSKHLTKDKSFAVRCKRTGNHEYSSQELAAQVGDAVNNATGASVNLDNPDFEISLDVRDKKSYVFTERIRCAGGMPLGTQGMVVARVCSEIDMLAAWLLMKRGAEAIVAGNPKYFEILEKWGLKNSIKIEMHSYAELEKLALENGGDAIVIGEKFNGLKFKEKETALPILRPLVGMSDDWIERKIVSIKNQ